MPQHGLNYDTAFLDSLPIVQETMTSPKSSTASRPIRTLSASQFDNLHHQHVLSHPPDSVLFPFLHGIEGDNEAQNVFFATQGQQAIVSGPRRAEDKLKQKRTSVKVPKYRGLMWVICEDDLENPEKDLRVLVHRPSDLSSPLSSDPYDEDSEESYFDEDDELDDDEDDTSSESFGDPISPSTSPYSKDPLVRPVSPSQMDVDIAYTDAADDVQNPIHGVVEIVGVETDEKHMHPVQHRVVGNGHALPTPIRTSNLPSSYHQATPSASTSMTSDFSTSETDDSIDMETSPITALTDYEEQDQHAPGRERSASSPPTLSPAAEAHPRSPRSHHHKHSSSSSRRITPLPPPILTSTFRVCDLLRRVPKHGFDAECNTFHEESREGAGYVAGGANIASEPQHDRLAPNGNISADEDDGEWEFVPLHVPEGISLRNFGIQVPILASLSDIVIYSPTPLGASKSPNALRLAKRFQQAIDRKRRERVGCEENAPSAPNHSPSVPSSPDLHDADKEITADDDDIPLKYNVFLLDANADEIRREMSHLVVKLCPEGQVPGSLGAAMTDLNSSLKSKAVPPDNDERDGDIVMSDDSGTSSSLPLPPPSFAIPSPSPNTVDFAQRERDEMRDLTRASEIISVFPEGHPLAHLNPDPLHPPPQILPYSHHIPVHSPSAGDDDEDEIDLTSTRTFWDSRAGQIYLGNANDVPLPVDGVGEFGERDERWSGSDRFVEGGGVYPPGNSPKDGYGYDICVECHDFAPFPSAAHLKAAEEKVEVLERRWREVVEKERRGKGAKGVGKSEGEGGDGGVLPPRPPPHPNCIIHLPMPSSPPSTAATMSALLPVVRFLQRCLVPTEPIKMEPEEPVPEPMSRTMEMALGLAESGAENTAGSPKPEENKSRRWSSVSSLIPSFPSFPLHSSSTSSSSATTTPPSSPSRLRSFTSPAQAPSPSSSPLRQNSISGSGVGSSSPNANADSPYPYPAPYPWSRPLKILLYSSDGYTESSVPALCLLMAIKGLNLPQAYLDLQVSKRRSFFVYQIDLGVLRRVEGFFGEERREEERARRARIGSGVGNGSAHGHVDSFEIGTHMNPYAAAGTWGKTNGSFGMGSLDSTRQHVHGHGHGHGQGMRPAAKSVSFAQSPIDIPSGSGSGSGHQRAASEVPLESASGAKDRQWGVKGSSTLPLSSSVPSLLSSSEGFGSGVGGSVGAASGGALMGMGMGKSTRRPRANTSPWLPSLFGGDHQSWFNDPRFDGSFPSRVLPFLYLGNLAHASNVYMLQALGITHVVSVGECALIPPSNINIHLNNPSYHLPGRQYGYGTNAHFVPGKTPNHQGSLWIEERAGRIKVLDIQGVCDDGIDTLEPQLEPICEWIDQARQEGGQVLVHCRVGVSRSATVTIAYVMKHLSLPLVDAYLIVRSRRLSVLIQPNMRLLYNLLGWEIKLAKERAGGDEKRLKRELSNALSWPFLAKEVHALNEKYLMH